MLDYDAHEETETDYLTLNPRGQIPALVLPDRTIITESAAMVLHIADAHPEANLLPPLGGSERARVYRWLFYAVANLYESYLRFYYSDRFSDDATATAAALIKQTARLDIDKYWDLLEKDMAENNLQRPESSGPYLLGNQCSVIDPYLLMLISWHQDPRALLNRCSCLAELFNAVRRRPDVNAIWSQNNKDNRMEYF